MKASKAFIAGVVGGAIMSVLLAIGRALGLNIPLELLLGTITGMAPGPIAWVLGLILHLFISGAIALVYGLGFEYVSRRSGALPGVVFSLVHMVVGGLFLGVLPALHPLIPGTLRAPGMFMSNYGDIGVIAFVVLHAIYGAIVGVMYGPVVHSLRRTTLGRPFDKRAPV
jgi:hypothetical protein